MELTVSERGQYRVLTVAGKVDWENARRLDAQVQDLIAGGHSHLVFDLDRVSFLCSGAIGALTYNLNKVRNANGACYVVSSNDYVNYIFQTLHFDAVFKGLMHRSWDELVASVPELKGAAAS
jgi:anti-sigma B factor antagonist